MTLKSTNSSFPTQDQIVTQDVVNATVTDDVLLGGGKLYTLVLKNNDSSAAYFRAADSAAVVVGTTTADIFITVPASTTKTWVIVDGLSFTNLSFWGTGGLADGTTSDATDLDAFLVLR